MKENPLIYKLSRAAQLLQSMMDSSRTLAELEKAAKLWDKTLAAEQITSFESGWVRTCYRKNGNRLHMQESAILARVAQMAERQLV